MLNQRKRVGNIGEGVACRFLESKGFSVIERNYLKKWGEIDIIAKKDKGLRFVEVKTVLRENIYLTGNNSINDQYRPEDNVHPWKIKRLSRAINSYLLDRNVSDDIEWQIDLVTIYLSKDLKTAKVSFMENIVL